MLKYVTNSIIKLKMNIIYNDLCNNSKKTEYTRKLN